jgi:hypothetical protein
MAEIGVTPIRRGITQIDVWAAADAVVAEGRRPTIDAVRQRLGRGSPNTVVAHLDSWFAHLAERLKDRGDVQSGALPPIVAGAVANFWDTALKSARAEVESAYEVERSTLVRERAEVDAEKTALARREEANNARVEAALAAARNAAEERAAADRREALALERLARMDAQLARLTEELERGAVEKRALQAALADEGERARASLERAEERLAGQERHWLGEVERARGETHKLTRARAELEAGHQKDVRTLNQQLDSLEAENRALRKELTEAKVSEAKASAEASALREALSKHLPTSHDRSRFQRGRSVKRTSPRS